MEVGRKGIAGNGGASRAWKGEPGNDETCVM